MHTGLAGGAWDGGVAVWTVYCDTALHCDFFPFVVLQVCCHCETVLGVDVLLMCVVVHKLQSHV